VIVPENKQKSGKLVLAQQLLRWEGKAASVLLKHSSIPGERGNPEALQVFSISWIK
jgi:hypothetical protein